MTEDIVLHDDTGLNVKELLEHCRALIYAMLNLESPYVRELLMYILSEKYDDLYIKFYSEPLYTE